MPSTYTNTGLELMADGEKSGTWGQITNENWELIEELATGIISIALTGTTYTLSTTDGTASNGRHAVIVFTGTPGGTCTVTVDPNDMQKVYWIKNDSNETVTMAQGSGGNISIPAGFVKPIYCEGSGAGAAVVDLTDTLDLGSLSIGGTAVTATAAELNILDGVTATAAELNILDGVTATASELNILDGVTATTAELNILDGVTATTVELNILDGVTATTAELNYMDGVTSNVQTQLNARVTKTSSTGSAVMPSGNTAQRDGSPSAGYLRFNSTLGSFEGYDGSDWGGIGGAQAGGAIVTNKDAASQSYTIASGENGLSVGPLTINSGVTITVSSGQRWLVL